VITNFGSKKSCPHSVRINVAGGARFNAAAANYESGGQEFESLRARHTFNVFRKNFGIG
jgi:hypothetical protein